MRWRRRNSVRRWAVRITGVVAVVALMLWWLVTRWRPVVTDFAESTAEWIAERTANEAVSEILEEKNEVCRSLVHVTYTDESLLSNVTVDAAAVNTIKTAVTASIMKKLDHQNSISVEIPLGTLAGLSWLSGWGPLITFPIGMNASVLSTVSSELSSVGINQSAYRVLVNVTISMCVITPSGRSFVSVDSAFPVAETVLLGDVPGALTEITGDDRSTVGKILDHQATD